LFSLLVPADEFSLIFCPCCYREAPTCHWFAKLEKYGLQGQPVALNEGTLPFFSVTQPYLNSYTIWFVDVPVTLALANGCHIP
jgi:hypothetical protein